MAILGLALVLARAISREAFEDLWLVRILFAVIPGLREMFGKGHGSHVSKTRKDRLAEERRDRWHDRFLALVLVAAAGAAIYVGTSVLLGWKFHNVQNMVQDCESAYLTEPSQAREICQTVLDRSDPYAKAAEAGRLKEPDAFWIGRATLQLLAGGARCSVRDDVLYTLAKVEAPDSHDQYRKLVGYLDTVRADIEASCRTRESLDQIDALRQQLEKATGE